MQADQWHKGVRRRFGMLTAKFNRLAGFLADLSMRIAILDNDSTQRAQVMDLLRAARHICSPIAQVDKLQAVPDPQIDLLIYHWQDPAQAQQQLKALRIMRPTLPVLLLIGSSPTSAFADSLQDGRTDYLVVPLRRHELLLRVRVLMLRLAPDTLQRNLLHFGAYAFDLQACEAWRTDTRVILTQKEFDLALLFFRHLGRPLSRATIHEAVWPKEAELNSRSLDTHVSRVRNKFGLLPEHGYRLAPVYGYGYQLDSLEFPAQNTLTQKV